MKLIQRIFYFGYALLCKLGFHSDYKYDGEWVGMCAFCEWGHPKDQIEKGDTFSGSSKLEGENGKA